jgi:hypothetical protein
MGVWILLTACDASVDEADERELSADTAHDLFSQGLVIRHTSERNETATWSEGERVLVNVSGAFNLKNVPFVYESDGWRMQGYALSDDSTDSLTLRVTYPCLEAYDGASLYDDHDMLTDVLYADGRWGVNEVINLQLKHLFAEVTVAVDESLRGELATMGLKVPARVTEMRPSEGTFTLDCNQSATSLLSCDGSDTYSFIVPSGGLLHMQLMGTTHSGGSFTRSLDLQPLSANTAYTCALSESASEVGIHDAAEFLKFVTDYNSDRETALKEYGVEKDEGWVVRILNDLDFSDVSLTGYKPLGNASVPFCDILDGMGHTLSHMNWPEENLGILYKTSADCVVRNLTLEDCNQTVTRSTVNSYFSLLVANMSGRMENCSISDSSITVADNAQSHYLGLFASTLTGTMVNCSLQNCKMKGGLYSGAIGALLRQGSVTNCRFENLTIQLPKYGGGVCGACQGNGTNETLATHIRNCWMHKIYMASSKEGCIGVLTGFTQNLVVQSCYYRHTGTSVPYGYASTEPQATQVYEYDEDSFHVYEDGILTETSVVELLNDWSRENGYMSQGVYLFPWTWNEEKSSLVFE